MSSQQHAQWFPYAKVPTAERLSAPMRTGFLQRKCACGGTPGPTGECEACRKKREAATLQRAANHTSVVNAVPPIVHDVLRSPGQPLDPATRAFFEPRFGFDFSRVRVHTGARAVESARVVNALAYTVGRDVVFGAGQYAPETTAGRRLMAHELTHVVQQQDALGSSLPITFDVQPQAEQEADRVVEAIADFQEFSVNTHQRPNLTRQEGSPGESQTEPVEPPETEEEQAVGPEEEAGGTATGSGSSTTGTTTQTNCNPRGLSRQDFLSQSGTSQNEFGLTTLDSSQVIFPQLNLTRVRGGFQVQTTTASLPNIPSVYTRAGVFPEGRIRVRGAEGADCPADTYPLRWLITQSGADKIRDGEQEHCNDFNHAFNISLGRYRDEINQLATSRRTFPNERSVKRRLQTRIGFSFDDIFTVFTCLATKSLARDDARNQWHTPRPSLTPPNLHNRCQYARAVISARSLPQVGQHPTPDLIKDCGETPSARSGSRPRRR